MGMGIITWIVLGLVAGWLATKFMRGGYGQLIYGVTGPLVAPFIGLFGTPQAASGAVLEVHTLIALVIYALVAWLLVRGAWLAFGEGRSASVARTDTVQTRAR